MNERKIRIFYEVANVLNMTRVAEKMFISQPSISQTISDLERELDVRLFERIGKKLYLTHEGNEFYLYVKRLINIYDEAVKNIKELNGLEKGKLNIGASTTIGNYILPSKIKKFYDKYPGVDILLNIENTQQIAELILDNKIDFAFVEGPIYDDNIVVKNFWTDELVLITDINHKWNNKDKITKKDIEKEKFIMREKGSGTRDILERTFIKERINYNLFMELGNTEAIKKVVEAGMGISCISEKCIKDEVEFGKISYFTLENVKIERQLYLIYHRDKYISKLISAFISLSS